MINCHGRGSQGITLKDKVPKKSRLYGQDFWARENRDIFDTLLEEYKAEHPGFQLMIGPNRLLTSRFFEAQPQEVQDAYWAKAKEELCKMNTVTELEGDEKEK